MSQETEENTSTHIHLSWGARDFISAPSSAVLGFSVGLIVLAFAVAGVASFYVPIELTVKSVGVTDSLQGVKDSVALADGQVDRLLVQEGDLVTKDQVIGYVRMEGTDEAQLQQFINSLRSFEQSCHQQDCTLRSDTFKLQNFSDPQLKESLAQVQKKFSDFSYAENEMKTKLAMEVHPLHERMKVIEGKLRFLATSKMRDYLLMQKEALEEEKGRLEQQIASTQNQLSTRIRDYQVEAVYSLKLAIQTFENFKEKHRLISPVKGRVASIHQTPGSYVKTFDRVMTVIPLESPMIAKIRVNPKDMGKVKEGDLVHIGIDAYPSHKFGFFKGKVLNVEKVRGTTSDGSPVHDFTARVSIDLMSLNRAPASAHGSNRIEVYPGMNVEARIVTGKATLMSVLVDKVLGKN